MVGLGVATAATAAVRVQLLAMQARASPWQRYVYNYVCVAAAWRGVAIAEQRLGARDMLNGGVADRTCDVRWSLARRCAWCRAVRCDGLTILM